ncbi:alpha/beta fold hydrolase [Knoellia aerolata]|uniref:Hydrolase n=1 Tax=Knoellia aerolata DSM 18566 TaxID=1385519 RepID=A0A0A0JZ39_9MICO|nr:alpha/beta hydrolase [Knoellia aerolata]KGN40811.1 hydrolase [Knoellia aerolata DSM 18566]
MEHVEVGGGVRVAVERVGSGPPLVLVHGAALDSRSWRPQLDGLSDELTVVAWDEPGVGRSSAVPDDYTLADFADALAAVVVHLGLGPAHVGGLSWGGTVVLECYRRHPRLFATLVLVDTYAGWKGSLPADEVRARVEGVRAMLAATPEDFDPTLPGLFAGEPPAELVAAMAEMAADVRPGTLERELGLMAETDLSDVLPRVAVATLLVWGELDARSPLRVAREFAAAIADAELVVIEGAGHVSPLERPDEVNAAIRAFVRRHTLRT